MFGARVDFFATFVESLDLGHRLAVIRDDHRHFRRLANEVPRAGVQVSNGNSDRVHTQNCDTRDTQRQLRAERMLDIPASPA